MSRTASWGGREGPTLRLVMDTAAILRVPLPQWHSVWRQRVGHVLCVRNGRLRVTMVVPAAVCESAVATMVARTVERSAENLSRFRGVII